MPNIISRQRKVANHKKLPHSTPNRTAGIKKAFKSCRDGSSARVLAALAEDLGLGLWIHVVAYNQLYVVQGDPTVFSGPHGTRHSCGIHVCRQSTHKNNSFKGI